MRNARKIDSRVTVGVVPDADDLGQLCDLGYKTVVDVREDEEKFGGRVERTATELGMRYVAVPISRKGIRLQDVIQFYKVIYEKGTAPLYAFSRFGKKPLAFLLLFDAVAGGEPLVKVFERASRIGIDLRGDLLLQEFLVEFYNSGCLDEVVQSIREVRPDLFRVSARSQASPSGSRSPVDHSSRQDREKVMHQRGCTVWLTGLPSCGKSTTAFALERELLARGQAAYVLDSDNVRTGMNRDLGFTREGREENLRRVAEMAKLFADAGVIVITSFISPYRSDRDFAREIHRSANLGFLEVFVDAPLGVCEGRDARGMYKRARDGELQDFTGVSAPYETPTSPEIVANTVEAAPRQVAARIVEFLKDTGLIRAAATAVPARAVEG